MGIRTPKQKYRRFQMRQRIWKREKSDKTSRACGKVRFKTELDAKIALAGARRQRRGPARQKDEQRYYRCPECHGYHLTSKPYRGRNRRESNVSKTTIIQPAAKLKGVSVFIERIEDEWVYTIPEFDAYGTTGSQEEGASSRDVTTVARASHRAVGRDAGGVPTTVRGRMDHPVVLGMPLLRQSQARETLERIPFRRSTLLP